MPPYSDGLATTWSPASAMLRMASVSAAWPDDDEQRADAALERGDAVLDDLLRGVADARVDRAEVLEREPVGGLRRRSRRRTTSSGRSAARGRRWRGPAVWPAWIWRVSKFQLSLLMVLRSVVDKGSMGSAGGRSGSRRPSRGGVEWRTDRAMARAGRRGRRGGRPARGHSRACAGSATHSAGHGLRVGGSVRRLKQPSQDVTHRASHQVSLRRTGDLCLILSGSSQSTCDVTRGTGVTRVLF